MTDTGWIAQSLGNERIARAAEEAGRRRIRHAFGMSPANDTNEAQLKFIASGLELRVFAALESEDENVLRSAALEAFQIARALPRPSEDLMAAEWLVGLSCLGVMADRGADVHRILKAGGLPALLLDSEDWGARVHASILDVWLRLFRKNGWEDLDEIHNRVAALRKEQQDLEPNFLRHAEERKDARPAWQLIVSYHLARAAEILGIYISQGSVDGRFDIRQQLEAQFDRAIAAADRGQLMHQENLGRLLARVARILVDNSIWTVTRAVNSRVTKFVESLTRRDRARPVFEMLPPQRRTLREEGLLGSGHRSVVVSLPTSSGKTFIAQFRILQALNQFDHDNGWVAYLAPTRALVNQLTQRLRSDFRSLGVVVEKVSPALEVDGLESDMLHEPNREQQFRVLVTTPEKLDLMLRGDWEEKIGRPLTLVVVDEAHGIASQGRGLKLELLLATINRECRNAQFLLLTPFIKNASEIARWLSPDSNKNIELSIDWAPNDRVIAIATPERGEQKGSFGIQLETKHTTRNSLVIAEPIELKGNRPLGFSWSDVRSSLRKVAASTAQLLQERGTVILLVDTPGAAWETAKLLQVEANRVAFDDADVEHIRRFLKDELGDDFPLASLIDYGIAVHHSGLSDDARTLVEWLTERSMIKVLVATTTIAQGVNFPVSGVVFASNDYRLRKHPFREKMPPEDFWNIAGRAGRVDQGEIGVVALAANSHQKANELGAFIGRSIDALNSTLVDMVGKAEEAGKLLHLESLAWQPGWSAFLQYLAHTYREIGNHEKFAAEVEQVLRGTLGFQSLRKSNKGWADQLVKGVYNYAERMKGKPLSLVDATGFSWESVSNTLVRISDAGVKADVWTERLFDSRRSDLQRMMGILLSVPELRESLAEVTGGDGPDGSKLARIICDWVKGRPLTEMALEYFSKDGEDDGTSTDRTSAMTDCCRNIFGRLTQTASWGLAAMQSLTLGDSLEKMSEEDQRLLRNLPARVYYGVDSDEAIALRLLGVPRTAATPLARTMGLTKKHSLSDIRTKLRTTDKETWKQAMGERGESYYRVWSIIES